MTPEERQLARAYLSDKGYGEALCVEGVLGIGYDDLIDLIAGLMHQCTCERRKRERKARISGENLPKPSNWTSPEPVLPPRGTKGTCKCGGHHCIRCNTHVDITGNCPSCNPRN